MEILRKCRQINYTLDKVNKIRKRKTQKLKNSKTQKLNKFVLERGI